MHPLLHLVLTRPQLLTDHAEAYAELMTTEMSSLLGAGQRRVMLMVVAVSAVTTACVLAGVALMLWSVLPDASPHAQIVLIMVPMLPLAIGVACLFAARSRRSGAPLESVRQQFKADMAMLREAGSL